MHLEIKIGRLLTEQASQWLETLRDGDPRAQAAFCEWLRQSRLHVEEFLEVVAIDRALAGLDAQRRVDVQALIRQMSSTVVPMERLPQTPRSDHAPAQPARKWGVALAAGVALCALALAIFYRHVQSGTHVATVAGEQRTLMLPDGSTVTLNGNSKLRVAFSADKRAVTLQTGEAIFLVARDSARPFSVHTSTAVVRALGTEFNVNHRPSGTVVSVLEGRVQIVAPNAVQDLAAGEQAQVVSGGHIQKKDRANIVQAVSWRRLTMTFEDTPLESLVAEFNRHSTVKIRLEGIEPQSRRYEGIFNVNDPSSLAEILEREHDLIVERHPGDILIRHRSPCLGGQQNCTQSPTAPPGSRP